MGNQLKILMAQINPTVGAIEENKNKIIECIQTYQKDHDLIAFPELSLTGYPPEDLLMRSEFHAKVAEALVEIEKVTADCNVIIGHPSLENDHVFNTATIFYNGQSVLRYHKQNLPNYGVFDEKRYFTPGPKQHSVINIKGYQVGICICEDIWGYGPVDDIASSGGEVLICINASPFEKTKYFVREKLMRSHVQKGLIIVYVNQVGGQDELVFDGQSVVMNKTCDVKARAKAFAEEFSTITINGDDIAGEINPLLAEEALIYQAICCGLKDYIYKNRFPGVVLGVSGGIDSALVLAIATDSLGKDKVHALIMPSRYSAETSMIDAIEELKNLDVSYSEISIENVFNASLKDLEFFLQNQQHLALGNLQARIRALFLMAYSNKTGNMLLCTSNKSEAAVGFGTLYGDLAGGLAILKDLYKTEIYKLAHYRNSLSQVIPKRVFSKHPSAELAENQKDEDFLPPYKILDEILQLYIEENKDKNYIIAQGYEAETVNKIIKLLMQNEFKRKQTPPGIKISKRSFNKDWRYPITSGFK